MKIHCEPGYDCRSFMTGDWIDESGVHVFHERTYWRAPGHIRRKLSPAELFHLASGPEPVANYWLTDMTYTDHALAAREAAQYGFKAQEGFYCEAPNLHWFPIFEDFTKALAFLKLKTGIAYEA